MRDRHASLYIASHCRSVWSREVIELMSGNFTLI